MTFAVVFPGQGSQSIGMLRELADSDSVVVECFEKASGVLGYDLWQLTREGPESELAKTQITQPAMLVAAYAGWCAWLNAGGAQPAAFAGHSLGEYTALVAAGSLGFEDAVALVAERGRLMQEAVPLGDGAMAAVMGLEAEQLEKICTEAAQGECVSCANYNAPGQIVIAGASAAVERASAAARDAGAKRAVGLPVSAPFHCEMMKPAADGLAARLADIEVRVPQTPVIHNVDAQTRADGDAIRQALYEQAYGPVRWIECVQALAAMGVDTVLEMGPGKVLTGMNKRIDRSLSSMAVNDPDTIAKAQEEIAS